MIKFEKVSYEQFKKDLLKCIPSASEDMIRDAYDKVELPKRSTAGSAGYDFVSPVSFKLFKDIFGTFGSLSAACETVLIPTGIRVQMPKDVVLMMYPRSGLGFKTGMKLANSTGVIDSDYYYSDNEGHIMAKFVYGFDRLEIEAGTKVMQGIFINYLTTDDDNVTESRNGGFGSTDKNKC